MAPLCAFLVIGIAAGRSARKSGLVQSPILDRALLDWLLPIAIAFNLSSAAWGIHSLFVVAMSIGITVLDAGFIFIFSLSLKLDRVTRRTLLAVAPLGNTAYFGFSAITALLGSRYLPDAIIFDQVGTTIMLATYGNAVARPIGFSLSSKDLFDLLRFRPLWGFALGLILDIANVHLLDGSAGSFGSAISASLLPVAMLALGGKLITHGLKINKVVWLGVLIRGIIGPALLILLLTVLRVSLIGYVSPLLQAAMPAMIAAALLADRRGLDGAIAFSLCAVGIAISCVTLPVMVVIIKLIR